MNPQVCQHWPLILSVIAIAQFWAWILWRRFSPARPLEAFPAGSLEIGFDANGPVIAVAGVLRSPDKQVFVQSMELTLTLEKDKSSRTFRWLAFKPDFLLPNASTQAWEMPHPFLVNPGEARKFNVVFNDGEAFQQVKGILGTYYHHWHETERRIQERRGRRGEANPSEQDELVAEFKRQEVCVASYTELDRKCYWEPGAYAISMTVRTENGLAATTLNSRFALGKAEAQTLKSNCVLMMDEPIAAILGKRLAPCKSVPVDALPARSKSP